MESGGNIGLRFAGSTSLPDKLGLGAKLSCTNFEWGKSPSPFKNSGY